MQRWSAGARSDARRNTAEARSNALDRQWNKNEQAIAESTALLRESEGNLGELFGVTRQVAGDAATVLSQSVLTTQYGIPTEGEERADFLRRVGGARERCRRSSSSNVCGTRSFVKWRRRQGRQVPRAVATLDDETRRKTRARPPSKRTSCASGRSP